MNQNLKGVLIFLTGAAAGGVSTCFAVKKYYEAKADSEIDQIRTAYTEKLAEIEPSKSSADGELTGPAELPSEEDVKNAKTKSSIVKELNNKPPLTDYTKFFKEKNDEKKLDLKETLRDAKKEAEEDAMYGEDIDPAETERPEDDEPYSDEEDYAEQVDYEGYQLNGDKDRAIADDKEPFEIDRAAYELECNHYDKQELVWYTVDNTLTNEVGEFVDENLLIGDTLDETGFINDDREALYIRNDRLMVDFTIRKVNAAFND